MRIGKWLALALVFAVAGCGGGGGTDQATGPAPTTPPPAGAGCKKDVGEGKQVRFGENGYLAGVLLGTTGTTGFVLGHMNNSNVCEWLPYGQELAMRGYRVLAFDFAGEGASDTLAGAPDVGADALAAAGYLKSQGVAKLILMGASKGGTGMLAAVPHLTGTVAGVITLSSPAMFGGVDVSGVPKTLTVPALYIAGRTDSGGRFASDAESMAHATPAGLATLVLVDSSLHGVPLLTHAGSGNDEVVAAVNAFLAKNAPL